MAEAAVAGGGLDRRRWVLLWVIGLAQLMVVLDRSATATHVSWSCTTRGLTALGAGSPPTFAW